MSEKTKAAEVTKAEQPIVDPVEEARKEAERIIAEAKEKAAMIEDEANEHLENANEKAEKIILDAEKKAEERKAAEKGEAGQNAAASTSKPDMRQGEELIRVKFVKDNDRYKDDITVSVNGMPPTIIKRGVTVTIPKKLWWVLKHQISQDDLTTALIESESNAFDDKKDFLQ